MAKYLDHQLIDLVDKIIKHKPIRTCFFCKENKPAHLHKVINVGEVAICNDCLRTKLEVCYSCFRYIVRGDQVYRNPSNLPDKKEEITICSECATKNGACEICGRIGGEKIRDKGCVFCLVVCDYCNEYVPRGSHVELDGYYLCQKDAESVIVCRMCENLTHIKNVAMMDTDDLGRHYFLCYSCYNKLMSEGEDK